MHANRYLLVQLLILGGAGGVTTGCLGPFEWKHDHPLKDQAIEVSRVSGRTITFVDGHSFELAGVSLDKLTAAQVKKFEAAVRKLLKDPGMAPCANGWRGETPVTLPAEARLVPFETADGKAIALLVSDVYLRPYRHPCCNFNFGFPIGPLIKHRWPVSFDLGARLVRDGWAHAATGELPPYTKTVDSLPAKYYRRPENLANQYASGAADAKTRNLNVHYTDRQAWKLATGRNNRTEIKKLLDKGIKPENAAEASGLMALWAHYGWTGLIKILIDQGFDPNRPASGGVLPLHSAVQNNMIEVIKLLLKHGADPHLVEPARGKSAIGIARARKTRDPKENDAMLQLLGGFK